MRLVLYFLATRASLLERRWEQRQTLLEQGIFGTADVHPQDVGGAVLVCESQEDISDAKIIKTLDIPNARGLVIANSLLYVLVNRPEGSIDPAQASHVALFSMRNFARVGTIASPFFNEVRSITSTSKGLLVTSAGLDLILEIDLHGTSLWEFWLTEHGYAITPLGTRRLLDHSMDHRFVDYPTLRQATHVNSALRLAQDDIVIATLFHQGQLIGIDRASGSSRVLLDGLKAPHHLRPMISDCAPRRMFKFLLSNSGQGQVLLLRENFTVAAVIGQPQLYGWIQDALYTMRDTILIADNGHKILSEIDPSGHCIGEWPYPHDFLLFQILEY